MPVLEADGVCQWHTALRALAVSMVGASPGAACDAAARFLLERCGLTYVEVELARGSVPSTRGARSRSRRPADLTRLVLGGPAGGELRVAGLPIESGARAEAVHYAVRRVADLVADRAVLDSGRAPHALIGATLAMQRVHGLIRQFASTRLPMLILGERGTGKGLVARVAHAARGGATADFFAINCAAVPESLAESALFGHRRGAFTGAHADRDGVLVAAHRRHGGLLLDDVAEFPPQVQPKLLHAVEEHEFYPVGSDQPVSIRDGTGASLHLYATSQPEALPRLRPDLRDRLAACVIELPPLRERAPDLLCIADARLAATGRSLCRAGWEALLAYAWPGNVRQLYNVLDRAAVLAGVGNVSADVVQDCIDDERRLERLAAHGGRTDAPTHGPHDRFLSLRDLERQHVAAALDRTHGNVTAAAQLLGLKRTTLQSRLRGAPWDERRRLGADSAGATTDRR
jgi:DNA-binding NtrC family response regulator